MNNFTRKLLITLGLLSISVLIVAYVGKRMIESSSVYEIALQKIKSFDGIEGTDLSVPLLKPFRFSESEFTGIADFYICDKSVCYQISAQKKSGNWELLVFKK